MREPSSFAPLGSLITRLTAFQRPRPPSTVYCFSYLPDVVGIFTCAITLSANRLTWSKRRVQRNLRRSGAPVRRPRDTSQQYAQGMARAAEAGLRPTASISSGFRCCAMGSLIPVPPTAPVGKPGFMLQVAQVTGAIRLRARGYIGLHRCRAQVEHRSDFLICVPLDVPNTMQLRYSGRSRPTACSMALPSSRASTSWSGDSPR